MRRVLSATAASALFNDADVPTSTTSPSPCSRWCGRPTLALTALSLLGRRVWRLLLAIPKSDARDRRSARYTAGFQLPELGEARVPRC